MVGPYRLSEFGLRLPSGAAILPADALAPLEEATRIIDEARARAADIAKAAEEAFEEERRRGHREGLAAASREAFEALLGESATLDRALEAIDRDLADVVVNAVRKVVADFDDATKAEAVVRAGLRQMRKERRAELFVPRALGGHFRGIVDDIRSGFPDLEILEVIDSDTLEGAAVVLETAVGRVEADFEGSLQEVEQALRQGLRGKLLAHAEVEPVR